MIDCLEKKTMFDGYGLNAYRMRIECVPMRTEPSPRPPNPNDFRSLRAAFRDLPLSTKRRRSRSCLPSCGHQGNGGRGKHKGNIFQFFSNDCESGGSRSQSPHRKTRWVGGWRKTPIAHRVLDFPKFPRLNPPGKTPSEAPERPTWPFEPQTRTIRPR